MELEEKKKRTVKAKDVNVFKMLDTQTGADEVEEFPYKVTPARYTGPLPEGYVHTNLFTALRYGDNSQPLKKLAIASFAMAVFPIGGFLLMRKVLLPRWGVHEMEDMISALTSIVIVQIVIAAYVVSAFSETDPEDQGVKGNREDQDEKDSRTESKKDR